MVIAWHEVNARIAPRQNTISFFVTLIIENIWEQNTIYQFVESSGGSPGSGKGASPHPPKAPKAGKGKDAKG